MCKFALLIIFYSVTLTSCYKPQVLEISVTGYVRDENDRGAANVTIFIDRGTRESMWPASYNRFDSVVSNENGKYSYLITESKAYYQVCCKVSTQYSAVEPYCKEVDRTIINGKTVPNIINFRLRR